MSIDTASGLTGFLDPLETLYEVLTDEQQQAKVFDLSSEFGGWRRCKGDGNCFYRACGFALVEALLCKNPKRLWLLVGEMRRSAPVGAEDLLALLAELPGLEAEIALETWYQALLINKDMDAQLVLAMRTVASDWLSLNEATDFNGMPIGAFVRETAGMDMETFRHLEVLADGKEAELLMIHATTSAFELHIEVVQLDRTPGPVQRYMLPQDRHGEPEATLLFRPGHYDIFYPRKLFQELANLEEFLNIRRSCRQPERKIQRPIAPPAGAHARALEGPASSDDYPRSSASGHRSKGAKGDELEDAMDILQQVLRKSAKDCIAAIDLEAAKFAKDSDRREADQQACRRLQEEIRGLRHQLELKKEILREHEDVVNRLWGGGGGGFFACCCSAPVPPATTDLEVPVDPPH